MNIMEGSKDIEDLSRRKYHIQKAALTDHSKTTY